MVSVEISENCLNFFKEIICYDCDGHVVSLKKKVLRDFFYLDKEKKKKKKKEKKEIFE